MICIWFHMISNEMNTPISFAFILTGKFVKLNTTTVLPLHLIWRKNSWNWILKHDFLLNWRKNSWKWILRLDFLCIAFDLTEKFVKLTYWNMISFWFDGKICEIEYFDLICIWNDGKIYENRYHSRRSWFTKYGK